MTTLRRAELIALAGTIPAFYMALLSVRPSVASALYLVACAASAAVGWNERGGRDGARASAIERRLALWLVGGLLLSGLLPAGDRPLVLAIRLATALLIIVRAGTSTRPWRWRGGLPYTLTLAVAVLGLCGLGFWWLEPQARTFGDGLWLAFTTAATVGYGDIVPSTPAAKIFAVFVVLMGFAALSLVTAAIAATWVQTEERRIEQELLLDLHAQLRAIRDELAALRATAARGPEP